MAVHRCKDLRQVCFLMDYSITIIPLKVLDPLNSMKYIPVSRFSLSNTYSEVVISFTIRHNLPERSVIYRV